MAKFVVAGKANCNYYAKAELLADYLQKNLPDFHVFKIVQSPDNWQSWLQALCKKNGWVHQKSPIIWRELVDRGGKGLLLGGFNDFMEYAQGYYGFTSDMMTALMLKIAKENLKTNEKDQEEEAIHRIQKKAMAIWISGALCPACAILIPALVNGEVFGHSKEVSINLLHIDGPLSVLQGLQMEIEDMAWPLLQKVTVQNSLRKAFMDAEVIILLDDLMPEKGQSIEDCYREMGGVYQEIAIKIDTFAKPNVRVIVADVKDVIVWGNIGRSTYIDLHKARVHQYESAIWGPPEFSRPVLEMLRNKNWIEEEFVEELHAHRPKIQAALKHGLGLSTAVAIQKVLNWWYHDSPPGEFISLGVVSQGDFDIPSGIIFSVPVRFCGGKWVIQSQIEISEETKDKLKDIVQELKKEYNFNFSDEKETKVEFSFLPGLDQAFQTRNTDGAVSF
ncbi:putative malate dehydrogenase 1B isoform X2 [Chiloscyllium punctatum]|uniref:putative malate dehydrogenase 1B isoform X2 n=1 Tax=Chiloscyllium punctatum TaxID=137246 RepID=UPI003B638A2B